MAPTRVMKHFETEKIAKAARPKHRKGTPSARTKVCREVVAEVAGLLPYEKRILDMIKTGGASSEKRMYKFAKMRLGTHKRALKKREEMKEINMQMKARQAMGN
mmetsp:Transcript_136/g.406  ORF Transcript_136/g.406 Transcript_136/m.406 type:complete len:104 (+) Transcript_136:109-420(+)